MLWYIAENNQPKEMPEEVLIYKIQNGEINPDTLVVCQKLREWIPLHETAIWENNCRKDAELRLDGMNEGSINKAEQKVFDYGNDETIDNSGNQQAVLQKNRKRTLWSIVLIAAIIVAVVIQFDSNQNKLRGEWILGNNSSLTFFEDGTAIWKSDEGSRTFEYSTNENIMTWYFNGTPFSYTWEIKDDVLYVDGEYYGTRQ